MNGQAKTGREDLRSGAAPRVCHRVFRRLSAVAVLALPVVLGPVGAGAQELGTDPGDGLLGAPELYEPRDALDLILDDWRASEVRSGTLTMRRAGGTLWSAGNGPASLELRLDGWSQDAADDPFCLEGGPAGCGDAAGARVGLEASFDLARNLELRLTVGTSGAANAIAADLGASIIWWFSEHVGLVVGFGYLQPLPGTGHSAVPAMLDFERAFTHETPYDTPDPQTGGGGGQWFGGFGLITRD